MVMSRNRAPVLDRLLHVRQVRRVLLGGQYIDQDTGLWYPAWAARLDANVSNELISGQIDGVARYLAADKSVYLVRFYDAIHFRVGMSMLDENGQNGRVLGTEPMGRQRYTQVIFERA